MLITALIILLVLTILGIALFTVIVAAARMGVPVVRTPTGMVLAGIAGGAVVYVLNRWVFLPPSNPMMRLVPQTAFFLAHLLFGLVVGGAIAVTSARILRRRPATVSPG